MRFVAVAKPEEECTTEDGLRRINPELGMTKKKGLTAGSKQLAKREQRQEQNHWQDMRDELSAMRLHFRF